MMNMDDMENFEDIRESIYDDNDDEGDVLYRDGNKILVVRKSLLAPKGDLGLIFFTQPIPFLRRCANLSSIEVAMRRWSLRK